MKRPASTLPLISSWLGAVSSASTSAQLESFSVIVTGPASEYFAVSVWRVPLLAAPHEPTVTVPLVVAGASATPLPVGVPS